MGMLGLKVSAVDTPLSSNQLLTTKSHLEYFTALSGNRKMAKGLVLPRTGSKLGLFYTFHSLTSGFYTPLVLGSVLHSPSLSALQPDLAAAGISAASPFLVLSEIYLPPRRSQTTPLCPSRVCAEPASAVFSGSYSLLLFPAFSVISIDLKLSPPPPRPSWQVRGRVIYHTSWTIFNPQEGPMHQELLKVNFKLLLFRPTRVTLSSSSMLSGEP